MASNTCIFCDSANLILSRRHVDGARNGVPFSFVSEFIKCVDCGEEYLTHEQSMAHSRARAAAVRAAGALMSPEQVRNARSALGFTQAQFELALGVGPKTVVRWERGTVAPSQAANGLLWIALHHPSAFRDYARERGVVAAEEAESVIARIVPSAVASDRPAVLRTKSSVSIPFDDVRKRMLSADAPASIG